MRRGGGRPERDFIEISHSRKLELALDRGERATNVIPEAGRVRRVMHYLGNVGMTGVETFLLTLCSAQRRQGLEPSIACDFEGRDELLASAARLDVEVHPLPLTPPHSSARGAVRKLASATFRGKRVRRLMQLLSS